ncbi:MAG: hypothetical protein A2046_15440 [Bacteroidetes bacterium GWA2_30_7]|nr:MAG: hypothetical protein A2046_15440 [Bacteroidetes bacterium GWA2_30_7]
MIIKKSKITSVLIFMQLTKQKDFCKFKLISENYKISKRFNVNNPNEIGGSNAISPSTLKVLNIQIIHIQLLWS